MYDGSMMKQQDMASFCEITTFRQQTYPCHTLIVSAGAESLYVSSLLR